MRGLHGMTAGGTKEEVKKSESLPAGSLGPECVCGVPADLNNDNFVKVEFFLQNSEVNLLDS